MTGVRSLVTEFEHAGGSLTLEGGRVKARYPDDQKQTMGPILAQLRQHRNEVTRMLRDRSATSVTPTVQDSSQSRVDEQVIPSSTVLMAPRYDSKPVEKIPTCWCCGKPYAPEGTQEWQGKQYLWLEPSCGCLDTAQAIACCGLCISHCACKGYMPKKQALFGGATREEGEA